MPVQTSHKTATGWINRMLEESTLPCFWLSNSIEVIEMPNPPLAQRRQMLRECGAGKVLDNTIRCIVDGTLKAQGFEKLQCNERLLPAFYSPAWINADQPLDGLVDGLRFHA